MSATTAGHPSAAALAEYALGKLDAASAETIHNHLDGCADCRTVVESTPNDTLAGLLRNAAAGSGKTPGPSQVGSIMMGTRAVPNPDFDEAALPPELREHPRYRILRKLGEGGMGAVYQAEHKMMERIVAIKVIAPGFVDSPEAVERFQREVRAAAKLEQVNIVRAYDADRAGGTMLLAMEYVKGRSLAEVVKSKGPLPVAYAAQCIRLAALGLQHAFENGMVHRDIKPHNLMLTEKGVVKILDFGLAKLVSERKTRAGLTSAGIVMGTPEYIAPEQARDTAAADIRADIYSLGCTLFCLLTGRPPFGGNSGLEILTRQVMDAPPRVSDVRPEVPAHLADLIGRMLAKNPADRPQTPKEVATALAPLTKPAGRTASNLRSEVSLPAPQPPAAGRPRALVLAAVAMAALATGALLAGIVMTLRTKDGVVTVEVDPPDAKVEVTEGAITVQPRGDNEPYRIKLAEGGGKLRITKSGFLVESKDVTLSDKGQTLKVSLRPTNPTVPTAGDGFVPLFNGKDLTGWKTHSSQPGNWRVENGVLIGSGPKTSHLYSSRGDYKDFHLRVEARINDGGNSGVIFRATFGPRRPRTKPAWPDGYEAQINSTHGDPKKTGSLLGPMGSSFPLVNVAESPVPPGEWFTEEVITEGNHIVIRVNGKTTADHFGGQSSAGFIALQQYEAATVAEFRKIEIKELSSADAQLAAPVPAPAAEGFMPLFNGKDLTGWHVVRGNADDWQVQQDELRISGTDWAHRSFLVSDREYTDYAVRFEFLADDNGVAQFVVRSLPGRPEDDLPGGHIRISADKHAGRFIWARGGYLPPDPKPQSQPPENWNRMEVRLHGRRLRVLVNGAQVQNLDLDHVPERPVTQPYLKRSRGTIEFSNIGGTVRLRNVELCDLSNTPAPTDPVAPVKLGIYPRGKQALATGDGEWRREGDELVQIALKPNVVLFFGDVDWTDYDFSFDAMRVAGPNGFDIIARAADKFNFYMFALGGMGNSKHAWNSVNEGVPTDFRGWRNAGLNRNEWYQVRVSVRGPRCQCFLDGELVFDFTDRDHLRGAVGFRTWQTNLRLRSIKVTAPDGKVLWEGVPELHAIESDK